MPRKKFRKSGVRNADVAGFGSYSGCGGFSEFNPETASVGQPTPLIAIYALRRYRGRVTVPLDNRGFPRRGHIPRLPCLLCHPAAASRQPLRILGRGGTWPEGPLAVDAPAEARFALEVGQRLKAPLRGQRPVHERRVPSDERPHADRHQPARRQNMGRPAHHLPTRSRITGKAVERRASERIEGTLSERRRP